MKALRGLVVTCDVEVLTHDSYIYGDDEVAIKMLREGRLAIFFDLLEFWIGEGILAV